jgi:hypothetical protein
MIAFGTAVGWLRKTSTVSWADCLAATATTNGSDHQNLYVGKEKQSGSVWNEWEAFVRFDLSAIPESAEITAAKVRLHIRTDSSTTDFWLYARRLTAPGYGTLASGDWDLAGTSSAAVTTATGITAAVGTTPAYMDIDVTNWILSFLPKDTTIDVLVRTNNENTAPTTAEHVNFYSSSDYDYGPRLIVTVADTREQILAALLARMQTIDALAGYNTTPATVSRVRQPMVNMHKPQFPCIFLHSQEETRDGAEEFLGNLEAPIWRITLELGAYREQKGDLSTAINELVYDIERALESDIPGERLGIDKITTLGVSRIITTENFLVDDNRASGLVEISLVYMHQKNES